MNASAGTKPNKKRQRALLKLTAAVLLAAVLTAFCCGCSGSGGAGGTSGNAVTDGETAATAPETTEYYAESTAPGTVAGSTGPLIPDAEYTFDILGETGVTDSLFCEEGDSRELLYAARSAVILNDYRAELVQSPAADVFTAVESRQLSGTADDFEALLVPAYPAGMRLLCAGYLENLSAPGLNITPGTDGVNSALCESCSFRDRLYLLFCDALMSDITATSALLYRQNAAPGFDAAFQSLYGGSPVSIALDGGFTLELMLTCLEAAQNTASATGAVIAAAGSTALSRPGSDSLLTALVSAAGGFMFVRNAALLPEVNITSAEYITAYDGVSSLLARTQSAATPPVFEVTHLARAAEGEIYLPLPRSSADRAAYVSQVDPAACSVLAVPAGVTNGRQVAAVLGALASGSKEIRRAYKLDLLPGLPDIDSAANAVTPALGLLDMILVTQRIDSGSLFGWGDIESFTAAALAASTTSAALLSDRTLKGRTETAATAASIVASRTGG